MVMSATSLAQRQPDLTEADVRAQLDGNLCRCTGYHNIVKAVLEGAAGMKSGAVLATEKVTA
jgi:carbon-monoxide dehydrogenase small subunit